jgi:pimeloyl-ACP methyl ester carboxylesterase
MSALFWTAAGVALLLLMLYFAFCILLVNKFLKRKPDDPEAFLRRMEKGPNASYFKIIRDSLPWFPSQPAKDVYTESYDGLKLHAKYLTQPDSRGTMLLIHGFHGSGNTDFGCVLQFYHDLKMDLLVIDQRSHLGSEGDYLTMGVRERYDVRSWALWLLEHKGENHPVVLDGISMGGASVLMAAGLDLPRNVRGIIADCPFSSPREIIGRVASDQGMSAVVSVVMCSLGALVYGGFRLGSASATNSVKHTKLPILILHGEEDRYVPCEMSQRLQQLNGGVRLETFPKAAHGMSYMEDPLRYELAVESFLRENLAG